MGESVFPEDMVHDYIVLMSVDTDARGSGECPVQQGTGGIMSRLCNGHAVDDMVWGVVRP